MCVILIKRPGVSMPPWNVLERCFRANPDGAGLAYSANGVVTYHKGLMTLDAVSDALDALPDVTEKTLILHFRWATHGGYSDALTSESGWPVSIRKTFPETRSRVENERKFL